MPPEVASSQVGSRTRLLLTMSPSEDKVSNSDRTFLLNTHKLRINNRLLASDQVLGGLLRGGLTDRQPPHLHLTFQVCRPNVCSGGG